MATIRGGVRVPNIRIIRFVCVGLWVQICVCTVHMYVIRGCGSFLLLFASPR